MIETKNYFNYNAAAKRYKIGRPNFHAVVIQKIKDQLGLNNKINRCLDVACGTGLLSKALLEIADQVVGIDNSEAMLNEAFQHPQINYWYGEAEKVDTIEGTFDLITVSSAFHWFKQKKFLQACHSKLLIGNYIVIHNNFFTSTTKDERSDNFKDWMTNQYLVKFVGPKRQTYAIDEARIMQLGYEVIPSEKFENVVVFNKTQLVDYLVTQSNIIAKVELGHYTIEEVKLWLYEALENHFIENEERHFVFGNRFLFLKKVS